MPTTGINPITTRLMPLSQSLAWYALFKGSAKEDPLTVYFQVVGMAASFYCLWALYKKFVEGDTRELGHISMGLTALGCMLERQNFVLGSIALVVVNFAVPTFAYGVLWMPARQLARAVKKTDAKEGIVWAYIFKLYLVSSMCFWSYAGYLIYQAPASATE